MNIVSLLIKMKSEWKMSKYCQKRITKTKAKLMNTKARHLENTIYFCKQLEGETGGYTILQYHKKNYQIPKIPS